MLHERVSELVFNVMSTYKVIWRRRQGFESHLEDWVSRESNSEPLGTRRVVYPLHHDGSFYYAYLYCCLLLYILILASLCKGSLTLAMGKCLWFSVKIKVCQSSLSSP